jgi:hypothetical protein
MVKQTKSAAHTAVFYHALLRLQVQLQLSCNMQGHNVGLSSRIAVSVLQVALYSFLFYRRHLMIPEAPWVAPVLGIMERSAVDHVH